MVFLVVKHRCASWTIRKAEPWKTDAIKLRWLEKTLGSSLDSQEIKFVNPKGKQPWIFTGRTDAFELWCWRRLLRVPWAARRIKPVNPKGNQPWIFIGRTDAEAEAPILWPPDVKSQLIGKDPDARKDWRQEEKEMTDNEMVGWHHWLNGHEFEQILWDGEGKRSLACCSSWGCKESDTTEQLNLTEM